MGETVAIQHRPGWAHSRGPAGGLWAACGEACAFGGRFGPFEAPGDVSAQTDPNLRLLPQDRRAPALAAERREFCGRVDAVHAACGSFARSVLLTGRRFRPGHPAGPPAAPEVHSARVRLRAHPGGGQTGRRGGGLDEQGQADVVARGAAQETSERVSDVLRDPGVQSGCLSAPRRRQAHLPAGDAPAVGRDCKAEPAAERGPGASEEQLDEKSRLRPSRSF